MSRKNERIQKAFFYDRGNTVGYLSHYRANEETVLRGALLIVLQATLGVKNAVNSARWANLFAALMGFGIPPYLNQVV